MGKKSNIKGGNKHKKYAKQKESIIKLNLYDLDKTDDQEFAFVMRMLGNKRCELKCYDKKTRIGLIRSSKGNMSKRKNWITVNSLVLISKRNFRTVDDKCDIIKLYSPEEVNFLISHKKILFNFAKSGSFQKSLDSSSEVFSFENKTNTKIKKEKNYNELYDISSSEDEDINIDYNNKETFNINKETFNINKETFNINKEIFNIDDV